MAFAILGILMARMVVFFSPFVCIYASVALCDRKYWTFVVGKLTGNGSGNRMLVDFLRHLILVFAIVILYLSHREAIASELEELREFWDPDTVDLMEWIKANTKTTAAFTGTMQL